MLFERGDDMALAAVPEPSSSEHPDNEPLIDHDLLDSSSSSLVTEVKELNPPQSWTGAPESVDQIASLLQFASTGRVDEVRQILDAGLDVNAKDYDLRTALHLAASEGHYGVVKLLLERDAYVNPVDRWRDTVRAAVLFPPSIYRYL